MIIYVPTKKYVYFDEDGNLLSVGNSNSEPGSFIEVEEADVINLITGKEQFYHYQVLFDTVKKNYILKHRFNEEDVTFDINTQIHKIPRNDTYRADLKITQDIKNKVWRFELDMAIKDNFRNKKLSFSKPLVFSITRYNDPHQLEKYVSITFEQILDTPHELSFDSQIELDPNGLSVYTIKRLETYYHEVINE